MRASARRDPRVLARLERRLQRPFEPDWVSASCWLARVDPLRRVGLFDPRFFLYFEDVDLCLRLRRGGWRLAVQPRARCVHRMGHSHADPAVMTAHFRRSRALFENTHGSRLAFELYRWFRLRGRGPGWDPGLRGPTR